MTDEALLDPDRSPRPPGPIMKRPHHYPKPQAIDPNDASLAGIHKRVMLGKSTQIDAEALMRTIDAIKALLVDEDATRYHVAPGADSATILVDIDSVRHVIDNVGRV